jgi:hypothetical protein
MLVEEKPEKEVLPSPQSAASMTSLDIKQGTISIIGRSFLEIGMTE